MKEGGAKSGILGDVDEERLMSVRMSETNCLRMPSSWSLLYCYYNSTATINLQILLRLHYCCCCNPGYRSTFWRYSGKYVAVY